MVNELYIKWINKIKLFSQNLSNFNLIGQKVWSNDQINGVLCTYRFQNDGRLIVGVAGEAEIWNYEFLNNDSLLITDSKNRKIILNHGFLFEGILILQKEGTNENVIFYDPQYVFNGDILEYIKKQIVKHLNLVPSVNKENLIHYVPQNGLGIGKIIYNENLEEIDSGIRYFRGKGYVIKNKLIVSEFFPVKLKSKTGNIIVKTKNGIVEEKCDVILEFENEHLLHGIYEILDNDKIERISVYQGRITKIKLVESSIVNRSALFIVFIVFLLALLILIFQYYFIM